MVDTPSEIEAGDEPGAPEYDPREHRYAVMLRGSIRRAHSGNRLPAKIRNISAGGLLAECGYPARDGDLVEIDIPRLGPVLGHIRWGSGGMVGIEFDGPIDPTRAWVKMQKSEVLYEMPNISSKRPGVIGAH
jgi:hypothetical protein